MRARQITRALGGDWSGSYGLVPGPGHSPRDRSVKVSDRPDGDVLVHSFAGQDWRTIKNEWCRAGLLEDGLPANHAVDQTRKDEQKNQRTALALWQESEPAAGTLVERYLALRGIRLPVPPSLRYHASLRYPHSGIELPAMVAAMQGPNRRLTGVQRTFLRLDGCGKAGVNQPKMSLGPMKGGAVRLCHASDELVLCEGVEDALAFRQMTDRPAWAVLGTSGFKSFTPPVGVKRISLAPDGDEAGKEAAKAAAERLHGMGLTVELIHPPPGYDWADLLGDFEERAAIAIADGHLDELAAELQAHRDIWEGG
jgi:hypothetical protein